jgi:hypothetical protein
MKPGTDPICRIEYLDRVVREDIPSLPKTMRQLIKRAIETRLTLDPKIHTKTSETLAG